MPQLDFYAYWVHAWILASLYFLFLQMLLYNFLPAILLSLRIKTKFQDLENINNTSLATGMIKATIIREEMAKKIHRDSF